MTTEEQFAVRIMTVAVVCMSYTVSTGAQEFIDPSTLTEQVCSSLDPSTAPCPEGADAKACAEYRQTLVENCKDLSQPWFKRSNFGDIWEAIASPVAAVLITLVTVICGVVITWLNSKMKRFQELARRTADPFIPNPPPFEHFATNVLLIGMGGSGKTTLIRALTGAKEANPNIGTDEASNYSFVSEISVEKEGNLIRRLYRIYVDDYVGQDYDAGVSNSKHAARRQHISSSTLVLLVDVFPKRSTTDPRPRTKKRVYPNLAKPSGSISEGSVSR